ncbi:MFS transporter [Streptomyces phytohabitans]|uniref:MFS transporter n=1 Tax=Streptomyces phytohabitans TaxID=1150371 RepID=UPI00345BDE98
MTGADGGSPLRQPGFRTLWLAGILDDTVDWMLVTAIPIFIYRMTGSALTTSVAFLIGLAPGILVSPFAGVVADRCDRRLLLLVCTLLQALLVLPLLFVVSRDTLWLLYAVVGARAACAQFVLTSKNSLLPALVGPRHTAAASNLVVLNTNLGRLLGSLLGGVAVAGGLRPVVGGALLGLLLAATLIGRIPRAAPPSAPAEAAGGPVEEEPRRGALAEWREGVAVILGDRRLRVSFLSATLCAVGQGLFVVLFVVFVARTLGGSDAEIGLLRSIQGVGGIAGGAALGVLGSRVHPRPLITWGALSFALLALVLWNGPSVTTAMGVYVGLFAVIGLPGGVYFAGALGMVQQRVPPAYLGRVLGSFYTTFNGAQVLGMAAAGLLGDRLGPVPLLNAQALLYLAAGLATLLVLGVRNVPEEPLPERSAPVLPAPVPPERKELREGRAG